MTTFEYRGCNNGCIHGDIITVLENGLILVTDRYHRGVQVFDEKGQFMFKVGSDQIGGINGINECSDGNIIVSDYNNQIYIFTPKY